MLCLMHNFSYNNNPRLLGLKMGTAILNCFHDSVKERKHKGRIISVKSNDGTLFEGEDVGACFVQIIETS
jgi:hypothetical protein